MTELEEVTFSLLYDLATIAEGLLVRTSHLARDQGYNEEMQKAVRRNRDLLRALTNIQPKSPKVRGNI